MSPTLHDVALIAGVSIKTVSNVVNDYPYIRPETRQRVLAAIEQIGYQPNLSARSLRSGRTGVIGLALPELSLSYFAELADSVMTAAEARGLSVVIEQTRGDRERELDVLSSSRRQLTDGLLFSPLGLGQDDADRLSVDFPLVLLGERIFGGPTDLVTMENVGAAAAATRYLIARGRTRIAVVGAHPGEVIGSAGLRLSGYRIALEEAGLPFDEELLGATTLWHRSNGATAMRDIIDRGVQFDAVFGLNDTVALGAMRVLQASGRIIPDDVAVIGFDNIDEAEYSLPALTTVDPGREEIARTAVQVLSERVDMRGDGPAPREVHAAFTIVERESA